MKAFTIWNTMRLESLWKQWVCENRTAAEIAERMSGRDLIITRDAVLGKLNREGWLDKKGMLYQAPPAEDPREPAPFRDPTPEPVPIQEPPRVYGGKCSSPGCSNTSQPGRHLCNIHLRALADDRLRAARAERNAA